MGQVTSTTIRWSLLLADVHARVNRINDNLRSWPRDRIEKELTTCDASVQAIREYAILHEVSITEDHLKAFTSIRQTMLDIEERLQYLKQPWWAKISNIAIGVVNTLSSIIGIGPVIPAVTAGIKGYLQNDEQSNK